MTDPERHAKIKAAYLRVVAKPEAERSAALDELCAGDPEMRREIETLLEFSGDAGETISIPGDKPPRFKSGNLFASRYRIVAALGRGSIGEVYRAEDTTLGVEVALKLLINPSPALVDRLLEEVRLARQITHPSICRVFDVGEVDGEYFFTMEYVDGEDLQQLLERIGRLPADKVREIGIQICDGVAAAHALGVLHRDLKPSNVMLDASGAVRITDFGVAVSAGRSESDLVSGTPAYMAPEQLAHSAPATPATDLYGVGLILYEATTGRTIGGTDADDTTLLRRNESFRKPRELVPFVPDDLEKLILELLRADPGDRPSSAAQVADRLRAIEPAAQARPASAAARGLRAAVAAAVLGLVAVGFFFLGDRHGPGSAERAAAEVLAEFMPAHSERSGRGVAVLPFEDEDDTPGDEHVVEAVQDDIIELLSRADDVRVIGEESVDRFARQGGNPRNARALLGADYVAYGRIDEQDGRLHLVVTLIDTADGKPIWENEYDATAENLDGVEHEISAGIAKTVRQDDDYALPRSKPLSANLTANDYYRRGMQYVPPYDPDQFRKSVEWLEKAVAEDPNMAAAYTAMGSAYVIAAMRGWTETGEGYEAARSNAMQAIRLNENLANAHVVRAIVQGDFDWDWSGAEASYRRALALNPSSAWAYRSYARFLSSQSRFDEAAAASRRAFEISPTSPYMMQGIARRFYEARNYELASAAARNAIELDPGFPQSYVTLCLVYLEQARFNQAVDTCRKYTEMTDRRSDSLAILAYAYSRAGRESEARETIQRVEQRGGLRGIEHAALALAERKTGAAIDALARAVDERARPAIWLAVHPLFDPFQSDPRFQALIERVGLPGPKARPDGAAARQS